MITLFSGTPGSGKSLHSAQRIYWWVKSGKPCICNFPINLDLIKSKKEKKYLYLDNKELNPDFLVEYAQDYWQDRPVKEGSILVIIDEAQMLFNSRDWGQSGRGDWLNFFTIHRHLGIDIILLAQNDRMLDRQIRVLVEYEYIHRKMSNFGWKGKVISALSLGNLFVSVQVWYPMKTKVGSSFFKAKKKYYELYNAYAMFKKQ